MTLRLEGILFLLFAAPLAALAAEPSAAPENEIEGGFSHYALTNSYANWDSTYVDAAHRFGDRQSLYGEVQEARRFNLTDREVSAGYYHPLGERWTALVEASDSPEHNFLAKNSVYGQLQASFAQGWDLQGGWRHSQYTFAYADLAVVTAERYWGSYRGAYTLYEGRVQGAGAAPSHKVLLAYYYADRSNVTLTLAQGRQAESLGPALGVLLVDVTTVSLSGRHWLNSAWGVTYEALTEHQGNLYSRKGIRLGLRYAF